MAQVMSEMKTSEFKAFLSRLTIQGDILDDLVYCQRSLRLHMRIHQALATRSYKLKPKLIQEIECEIVDISHEQSILLNRLRKALEFHYITTKNDNIEMNRELGNALISRMLANHIDNDSIATMPKSVKRRMTELQLLSHYNLQYNDLKRRSLDNNTNKIAASSAANLKQESLLKPKSERFAQQKVINTQSVAYQPTNRAAVTVKTENNTNAPAATPRSIDSSRLNLLEALQKARNQNLNKPKVAPQQLADTKETIEISSSSQSSTTSDDSSDVALLSPLNSEEEAEELNQETFLRKFGLYTIEHSQYLKQKRTQRKRRNVQRNQKSDYHYGKLEMFETLSKRKRTYLDSPPAARGPKRRRAPNGSKSTSTTDRSSSSSPDQKLICFECNKNSDSIRKCDICPNWYHVKCHKNVPRPIAREICSECYIKSKEKTKSNDTKYLGEDSRKIQKSLKDVDLGVAPLDVGN